MGAETSPVTSSFALALAAAGPIGEFVVRSHAREDGFHVPSTQHRGRPDVIKS